MEHGGQAVCRPASRQQMSAHTDRSIELSQDDYAGLDRRLMAFTADVLLLYSAILVVQGGLYWLSGGFPFDRLTTGWLIEAWVFLTVSLPTWAYFTLSERSKRGATLGKRLFRLQVTSVDMMPIGFGKALSRTVVKLLPWEITHLTIMLPTPWMWDPNPGPRLGLVLVYALLGANMVAMIFSRRKQGLHDFLARTVVIRI